MSFSTTGCKKLFSCLPFAAVTALLFLLAGCSAPPLVKTDLKTFLENPDDFAGKHVIITTTIKDLSENPDTYLDRKIEVSGFVEYRESRVGAYWNFTLKEEESKEEHQLYCYEDTYRVDVWIQPLNAVRQAVYRNKQLTVVGNFQKGMTLELDWIEYEGQHIDTDFLPPAYPRMYW